MTPILCGDLNLPCSDKKTEQREPMILERKRVVVYERTSDINLDFLT